MSLKDIGENKAMDAEVPPVPRSIPALRSLMGEVRACIAARRLGALAGLVEELHNTRRKVYAEMVLASRIGAPSATIEAYSGICNEALDLYGEAQSMSSGLGSVRS